MIKRIVKFKPATEPGTPSTKGFTLVELLVVISIIAILAFLALPAIQGLQKGGGFAKAVYDISDSLNLARSYALANNTYVFVGLTEVDRTQSITAAPQTTGMGRVALAMVASKDGTNNPASGNLTQVRPTQIFDFLHIDTTSTASWPTTLNMTRPTGATIYNLGQHANTVPTSTFSVPLGGTAKFNFNAVGSWVVTINPQGNLLLNGTQYQWFEIDLLPVVGTVLPTPLTQKNLSAVQIDGLTGAVTVYRP